MSQLKYKLTISYEGMCYSGWQVQPDACSIQGEIERALAIFLKHPCRLVGAGRTDAGVHALGQIAHFTTDVCFDSKRLLYALAGLLPDDIRVMAVECVDAHFHAQYSAKKKIYRYRIWQQPIIDPFVRRVVCHYHRFLNLELLDQALLLLHGKHDFAAFANQGTVVRSTIRELFRVERFSENGGFSIEFEGDGFLYKMVRNLMGTILDISSGKRPLSDIQMLFECKDRKKCSPAAVASGLCLMQVIY